MTDGRCLVRAGEWCFRKFLEEIGGGGHSTVAEMSDHIRKAIAAENFLQPCRAVRGLPCPHVPLTPHYENGVLAIIWEFRIPPSEP